MSLVCVYIYVYIYIRKWKCKSLNHVWFFVTPWTLQSMEFSRPEYWRILSLLHEIFPTQGSNPGLPHCRQILYQGKPKNTGVGSLFHLQWIFSTQESNWCCMRILYQLTYDGSPDSSYELAQCPMSLKFFPLLSSRSFIVLHFTLRSINHFELIFWRV